MCSLAWRHLSHDRWDQCRSIMCPVPIQPTGIWMKQIPLTKLPPWLRLMVFPGNVTTLTHPGHLPGCFCLGFVLHGDLITYARSMKCHVSTAVLSTRLEWRPTGAVLKATGFQVGRRALGMGSGGYPPRYKCLHFQAGGDFGWMRAWRPCMDLL